MPWSYTSPMDQNIQFIADDLRNRFAVTERCALYGVSRKTGDTWIDRSLARGPQGLEERARRPRTSPRHTPEYVVAAILAARQRHPSWGAKKLVAILSTHHPRWPWPAHSTVCDILSRHGVVPKKRRRRVIRHPGNPIGHIGTPNEVWSAACTGHFQTGEAAPARNSGSSTTAVTSSTMHGRMRRSTGAPPPPATSPPLGQCPPNCHRSSTPTASRCAMSAPTVASGGTIKGSTSPPPVPGKTSASRQSMRASGMSTADR
jgi:transposase